MTDLDIVRELHGAADRASLVCTKTGNFRAAMIDAAHLRAAADEIERLREQLRLANIDNFNTTAEVDRLRAERDEARRELCAARRELCRDGAFIRLQRHRVHRDSEDVVGLAKEIAVERGWDCFKENGNG